MKPNYSSKRAIHQICVTLLVAWLFTAGPAQANLTIEDGADAFFWKPGSESTLKHLSESAAMTADGSANGVSKVSVRPQNDNVSVTFETALNAFVDEQGGYGSDIYATLEYFELYPSENPGWPLWLGWQNRYDIEAIRLTAPSWHIDTTDSTGEQHRRHIELVYQGSGERAIVLEYVLTRRDKAALTTLGLESALMQGYWLPFRALCLLIWDLLSFLYDQWGSWGLAIITLSLLIRLVTIPITRISLNYQNVALAQQNRINDKVVAIKKTYSGIELSEKMVELYEKEGYDHLAPFKGMMGLLIQIPILIALFAVIGEMSGLREQSFLWISDLSLSDRLFAFGVELPFFGGYFNLLPFLMAAATLLSTWVSGYRADIKASATSLYGMSLIFFVFFYSFPAALVLYWFTSNFFQLLQQLVEMGLSKSTMKAD